MKKLMSLLISQGLLIFSCTTTEIPLDEPTEPIVEIVTYTENVKAIIDGSCISCHDAVNPSAGLRLLTYTQVRNSSENGNLIERMNNATNPMPPNGLLPADVRAVIDAWAEDGFLEN